MYVRAAVMLCCLSLLPTSAATQSAERVGEVSFPTSCAADVSGDFDRAVALLHSFEFEESRNTFASIAGRDPDCAMAHWGVAMTYHHLLWAPPTDRDLELGTAAAARALELPVTDRERAYTEAIAAFYRDYERQDHATSSRAYETAMARLHEGHPDDVEAEIFYIVSVLSNADPTDKSYAVQKRTGAWLESLWAKMPNHPGIVHYIIHSYDYPPLSEVAVEAAHRYLEIAPSLPHAVHMSSHIFTQEGMWEASIRANTLSAGASRDRGEELGTVVQAQLGEMHALDYLAYAYLQRGQNDEAKRVRDHIASLDELTWSNGVVAFNAGAVPVRYALERRAWEEAASLPPAREAEAAGGNYQVRAVVALRHWARAVGAAQSGQLEKADRELARLTELTEELGRVPDVWARNTAEVLRLEAEAWLALARGEADRALSLMRSAAALEDQTDKSSLSPGRVLPVHEQLGDMLMELGRPGDALREYETSLAHARQRFNSYYGAARAARAAGELDVARDHYRKLLELTAPDSPRPELKEARLFLES